MIPMASSPISAELSPIPAAAALSGSLRGSAVADAAMAIFARLAKHHKTLLNIVKHHETHVIDREPLVKPHEPLVKHHETLKHSSFDATISALSAEMSALSVATSTSAIVPSYRRYRCGVFGDCGVGITPQMCNRVTNHHKSWRYGTFSKPV